MEKSTDSGNFLSVVVPCYNEEEALPLFYDAMRRLSAEVMPHVRFEFLFIDDGSKDRTLEILREMSRSDDRVRYVSLSRNFGKEAGIYAGLQHARGDYVVVMDVDLQNPPSKLPEMYQAVTVGDEGGRYDSATSRRMTRKGEPVIRSFFARWFYRIINRISDTEIVDGSLDFRMMSRQMVDAILSVSEYNRFSKGIFSWVGFRTKWFPYDNIPRAAGRTKWSFWSLVWYSIDGIVAFSTAPLALSSLFGILFCFLALLLGAYTVVKTLAWGEPVAGYPTLVCVVLFVGGIQLLLQGVQGQYLSKAYLEAKRRPIYLVHETETSVKSRQNCGVPDDEHRKEIP